MANPDGLNGLLSSLCIRMFSCAWYGVIDDNVEQRVEGRGWVGLIAVTSHLWRELCTVSMGMTTAARCICSEDVKIGFEMGQTPSHWFLRKFYTRPQLIVAIPASFSLSLPLSCSHLLSLPFCFSSSFFLPLLTFEKPLFCQHILYGKKKREKMHNWTTELSRRGRPFSSSRVTGMYYKTKLKSFDAILHNLLLDLSVSLALASLGAQSAPAFSINIWFSAYFCVCEVSQRARVIESSR